MTSRPEFRARRRTVSARALDLSTPFTREQACAAGLTWRYLDGPRCLRLFPGVYLDGDVHPTASIMAKAALMVVPEATAVCHVSAAEVMGLPVPHSDEIHLLVPPGVRVRRRGIRAHVGVGLLSSSRGVVHSTALLTFVDVARDVPLVDAVVLGDAIVRRGLSSVAALRRAADLVRGRGAARVREAAALVRAKVDSPQETRLRLLMVLAGLPEPEIGHSVTASGRARFLDLAYPEFGVAVEYDGRHHVERDQQWSDDIARREELGSENWHIVSVTGLHMGIQSGYSTASTPPCGSAERRSLALLPDGTSASASTARSPRDPRRQPALWRPGR